jgi:uncharacterized membrane protein
MAKRYWSGFATGAAAGAGLTFGSLALASALGRRNPRIVRLEKSLQIGRPVEEVFQHWADLDRLPEWSDCVEEVFSNGPCSHWVVKVDGHTLEWDAEIEQFIPNEAIGWKSVNGPKHTGRITFSKIGSDTLVQVTMNYAPPSRFFAPFSANVGEHLEHYIEQVLRDFKARLEGKGQEGVKPATRSVSEKIGPVTATTQKEANRATGTMGPMNSSQEPRDKFGTRTNPVEFTSPPEAKR